MSEAAITPAEEIRLLLSIINALPPSSPAIEAESLITGHRIWGFLRYCDPDSYKSNLPASIAECDTKWVARHENLKRIEKSLLELLHQNGVDNAPQIDLKLLAEQRSSSSRGRAELSKFLRTFMYATIVEPYVNEWQRTVFELPPESQDLYVNVVQNFPDTPYLLQAEEVIEDVGTAPATPAKSAVGAAASARRDPELYREELESAKDRQIALLQTQKAELEDTIRHYENRIERLRKNNQDLDEKIKYVEDSLRKNEASGSQEAHIYSLETKIEAQDRLIEEQEDQLDKLRQELARITADLNQLRKANDEIQPLRDEVDELQHRYDEAARKANMVDKYAQKLEEMKEMERNYKDLRGRMDEMEHSVGDGDSAVSEIASLKKTIEQYRSLLPGIETERHEYSVMLNSIKEDYKILEEQLIGKKEELSRAEETIIDLRNASGLAPIDDSFAGLADEMEDSERKAELEAMDPEERSRTLAKDLQDERAKGMFLSSQLEDQKTFYTQLEKRYEELNSEKVALERAARAASEGVPPTPPPKDDAPADAEKGDDGETSELQAEIAKLKERIKLMETENPQAKKAADAALLRQEVVSLRNETKLIASAWYGLNRRSQMNSAILQKKTEVPLGNLGRARAQIEKAIRVKGR